MSSSPWSSARANGPGNMPNPVIIARSMSRIVATPSSRTRQDSTNAFRPKRSTSVAASVVVSAAVLIEPLPGLLAEVAGGHQLLHALVHVEPLAVGVTQVLGDLEHGVQPEHVGEEERPHRQSARLLHELVDLLRGETLLLLDAPDLGDRGIGDAVADEPRNLAAADRHLADRLGEVGCRLHGLRRRVVAL